MSNKNWGSDIVPHYSVPSYGKDKKNEEEKQPAATAVKSEPETNPAASWDAPANVLGATAEAGKTQNSLPQWDKSANFAIKNSLQNDFGIDGKKITYKDGDVLLDGKFLMRADNNVDGTTYAKDYDAVAQNVNNYIKNNGLVGIRDYAASSGTAVNVSWNAAEKTVSINGKTVVPTAIVDGKAYVPKSQIDAILSEEQKTAGTSYGNIYDKVQEQYGAEVNRTYNDYINASEFNYDPEKDPAYQAYIKVAKKAIEDEYKNNMAAARFRTGGVGSTGQMLSAAAIREGAVDDLTAARAQFEQNAYTRYMDDLALKRDRYEMADGRMDDEFNTLAGVNAQDKQDFYNAHLFDDQMQMSEFDIKNAGLEYGNNVRNYEISEKYAPILAEFEVNNDILQYVTDRESLIMALQKAGYTPERIKEITTVLDVFSTYING